MKHAKEARKGMENSTTKERMLLVLMAGQSNMAGRGIAGPDDLVPIPGVLSLHPDGNWGWDFRRV